MFVYACPCLFILYDFYGNVCETFIVRILTVKCVCFHSYNEIFPSIKQFKDFVCLLSFLSLCCKN